MRTFALLFASLFLGGCAAIAPLASEVETPTAVFTSSPTVSTSTTSTGLGATVALLQQAQAADPERYQFALEQGAQISPHGRRKKFLPVVAAAGK